MGGQVVHGMLAASFVSTLIGMHLPGPGALWNEFEIRWKRPIRIGTELEITGTVRSVSASTNTLDLDITGAGTEDGAVFFEAKAKVTMIDQPSERPASEVAGKRILVTGASGDVGAQICARLSHAGAQVVAWGRNRERFERHGEWTRNVPFRSIDLSTGAALARAVEAELESGSIAGLVHAAGAMPEAHAFPDDGEALREHWRVSVEAFYEISRALLAQMAAQSVIVAVLSQYVFDQPPPKLAAYVSAKMALWGLIRSMALEYGPAGIRVNAVSPSMMNTAASVNVPLRTKQVESAKNPLRRMCEPEDVAEVVAFLCGPGAAFINGANIPVTGGASMP